MDVRRNDDGKGSQFLCIADGGSRSMRWVDAASVGYGGELVLQSLLEEFRSVDPNRTRTLKRNELLLVGGRCLVTGMVNEANTCWANAVLQVRQYIVRSVCAGVPDSMSQSGFVPHAEATPGGESVK